MQKNDTKNKIKKVKKTSKDGKKSNVKEDKVLILLIIILIGLTLFLIITNIVRGRNLNPESDLVAELHNYFNTDDLTNCDGLFNYVNKPIKNSDVATATKLCMAYQKSEIKEPETETLKRLEKSEICQNDDGMVFRVTDDTEECTVSKIDRNIIDDTYKKLFGEDIKDNKEFKADNTHICYLKGDKYYCGLSETFSYTFGNESTIYRVLNKAIKKGREVYLYDYFIMETNNICYKDYPSTIVNKECSDEFDEDKMDFEFMEKYATKYKHTYRKGKDGNYYWVSSEPITEE